MLLYVSLMVFLFWTAGFWDTSAIKDTIIWTFGVASVLLVNSSKAIADQNFFKKTIRGAIGFAVVLEFIVNLYTFPLFVEAILVPLFTCLLMLELFAANKPEYAQVHRVLTYVLGMVGLLILALSVYRAVSDPQEFATWSHLRDLLLPPIFTLAFVPFIYLLALYMAYELVFVRIGIFHQDDKIVRFIKCRTVALCQFNLGKISKWSRYIDRFRPKNRREVIDLIKLFENDEA